MEMLHRIDFLAFLSVCCANPNGDPLCGGRPRTDPNGYGIITDVSIKRRLRDRLAAMGEPILITPPTTSGDCIAKRISAVKPLNREELCRRFFDVRAFGQVFALKRSPIFTESVRGAVSISHAISLHPAEIIELPITRCINADFGHGRGKDTMGFKSIVRYALYPIKGTINTRYAVRNGFTSYDAEKLKQAMLMLYDNDISAAHPAGSMAIERLYTWRHRAADGDYPMHAVFNTVKAELRQGVERPLCFEDYVITEQPLPSLNPEITVFCRPMDVSFN